MSRILVCPEAWANSHITTLPDPRYGQPRQYMVTPIAVYEVMRWSDDIPRSWILDDTVQEDGFFYVCLRVDPLFLILPHLAKAKKEKNVFTTLDVILPFQEHGGFRHLDTDPEREDLHKCMHLICDVKGSGDMRAFRLNDDKLMRWLKAKTIKLARELPANMASAGAASSTFVASSTAQRNVPYEAKLAFAFGAISRFLSKDFEESLRDALGISVPEPTKTAEGYAQGDDGEQKLGKYAGMEPTDDYSRAATKPGTNANAAKRAKLTPAQKRLAKVDKKGMKSISAFFGTSGKKPKKTTKGK